MACLSLGFIENLLIWLVIIGAVFALVKLLIPLAMGPLGAAGAVVVQALNIVLWAALVIIVIIFVFSLISCLLGGPHLLR